MTLPQHNLAVFYSAADEGRPWVQLSVTAFIVLVVIPMIVVGLVLWWPREPKG